MRRAAISIPSNLAEGRARNSRKDFVNFLHYSFSSGAELETQIEIAKMLPKTKNVNFQEADLLLDEVMRILNTMIKKLKL